jgi:hypothetical protein
MGKPTGSKLRGGWTRAIALVLVLAVAHLAVIQVSWAQEAAAKSSSMSTDETSVSGAGLGAASVLCTLVYSPLKIAFAIVGGVTGGLTYVFSGGDTDAAMAVWGTSVYGTYVITPDHLKGDKAVRFLGVPPAKEAS